MATNRRETEVKFLSRSKHFVNNLNIHPEITAGMDGYFFNAERRQEGRILYDTAEAAFESNISEHKQESAAYDVFESLFDRVENKYSVDKKKAIVAFKRNSAAKEALEVDRAYPDIFDNQFRTIKNFYSVLHSNEEYMNQMKFFKFSMEDVANGLQNIADVDSAYGNYLAEQGEAQQATKMKNAALAELDTWINDCTDIAELAFMDRPQLLEILGIVVKS